MMAPAIRPPAKCYVRYVINGYETFFKDFDNNFSVFLCQGERSIKSLMQDEANKQSIFIKGGYARLQDFNIQKRCKNLTNPKILYMPTHGAGSSLVPFSFEILKLARTADVICKAHPDSYHKEPESKILDKFRLGGITVIDESINSESWLENADIFLTDFGGSTLLGLYFQRPTIFLNPPKEINHFDYLRLNIGNIEPIELYLRKFYPSIDFENRIELCSDLIIKSIKNFDNEKLLSLRDEIFYTGDKLAGEIFAEALIKIRQAVNHPNFGK